MTETPDLTEYATKLAQLTMDSALSELNIINTVQTTKIEKYSPSDDFAETSSKLEENCRLMGEERSNNDKSSMSRVEVRNDNEYIMGENEDFEGQNNPPILLNCCPIL